MQLHFRILNVVTAGNDALSGNPLCVFEDARALSDETMQVLALQFNLVGCPSVLSLHVDAARDVFVQGRGIELARGSLVL